MEIKTNASNRYRLNDYTARKLGIIPNRGGRYRLSKKQIKAYFNLDQDKVKRLFFDLETTPNIVYSWRIGWKINIDHHNIIEERKIICVSYNWEDSDTVHNITWDKNKDDKSMLEEFIKIANKADELVAHNGDRFDLKWLRTRAIYHRLPMFPQYKTLDTLKKAKSSFNFNSNRLDYIAKFLGVGAKLKHEGFDMWIKVMQGDKQALIDMVTYCNMDIVVLKDVYLTMQNYIIPNVHTGVVNNKEKYSCPNCASKDIIYLKSEVTAMGTIKRRIECQSCGFVYNISNRSYMQYLKDKWNKI